MAGNQIKKLDQNAFRGLRFLRRLYLADNVLGDVGRGTFGSLKRIGTIDLARNQIKKIDFQMFYDLNFIEVRSQKGESTIYLFCFFFRYWMFQKIRLQKYKNLLLKDSIQH